MGISSRSYFSRGEGVAAKQKNSFTEKSMLYHCSPPNYFLIKKARPLIGALWWLGALQFHAGRLNPGCGPMLMLRFLVDTSRWWESAFMWARVEDVLSKGGYEGH